MGTLWISMSIDINYIAHYSWISTVESVVDSDMGTDKKNVMEIIMKCNHQNTVLSTNG